MNLLASPSFQRPPAFIGSWPFHFQSHQHFICLFTSPSDYRQVSFSDFTKSWDQVEPAEMIQDNLYHHKVFNHNYICEVPFTIWGNIFTDSRDQRVSIFERILICLPCTHALFLPLDFKLLGAPAVYVICCCILHKSYPSVLHTTKGSTSFCWVTWQNSKHFRDLLE